MEANMSNLVHNERLKMMANFWNNLGVASITTGWIVPLYNATITNKNMWFEPTSVIAVVTGFGLGLMFWFYAQFTLTRLKE